MKLKLIQQRHNSKPDFDVTDVLSGFRLVEQGNGIINLFFQTQDKYMIIEQTWSGYVSQHEYGQCFRIEPFIEDKYPEDFPTLEDYYNHEQYYCIDLVISGIVESYRCDIMPLKHEYHVTLIPLDMCVVDKSQDNLIALERT